MREWKTCPQNRNYLISNDGLCKTKQNRFEGRYLKPAYRPNTNVYVLCQNYNKKAYPIRHLVYTAFIGKVPNGYIVFNKDGNKNNNNLENLDIMPRPDKIFYFCRREKKIPRMTYKNKYTFIINNKTYKSSNEVMKDYPILGTRQNLCHQADRWISKTGRHWNPNGFIIRGVFIWAKKQTVKNPTKIRMDDIKLKYNI